MTTEIFPRCGHLRVPSNIVIERGRGLVSERCLICKRATAREYQATYKMRKERGLVKQRADIKRKEPRIPKCERCDAQGSSVQGRCYTCATGRPRVLTPETLKEYALANPDARVDAPISARGYRPIRGAE